MILRIKKVLVITFSLIVSASLHSQGIMLEGKEYVVDTLLFQKQIGPGVLHSSYRLPSYPLDFHVMEVDLNNPYVEIETCKAGDKGVAVELPTRMGTRKDKPGHEVIGGTNGDFYFYQDPVETGIPRSGQFLDGEMIANPTGRASFVLDMNKKPYIDRINYRADLISGKDKIRIHTVNMQRLEWEPDVKDFLTLYTDKYGTETSAIDGGTKVVIRPKLGDRFSIGSNDTIACIVESIIDNPGTSVIPEGKAVLHGREEASTFLQNLSIGSEITMAFNTRLRTTPDLVLEFKELVGGSNTIVLKNGSAQNEGSTASGKNPRTAMGISQDETKVYMVVVDGRSGKSAGVDYTPLGEVLKAVGAWNAVNLDGGGSSVMFVNNQKIVNTLSGGTERPVGNGVLVISNAPEDDEIGVIKPHISTLLLPFFGEYFLHFYGYNQYGSLKDEDLKGVVLSCPESLGRFEGNKFIASGNTPGQITATYNGKVTTTIDVDFLPVSDIKIRLDSVIVDNRKNYPIEVIATTGSGESLISPTALTWEVKDESICTIDNGVIVVLRNGVTEVVGQINNVTDILKVKVEIPKTPEMIGDSVFDSDWKMKASAFLQAQWNKENIPEAWVTGTAVNFVHAEGRAPYIQLTNKKAFYGLPDTIKMVLNIGDMLISRAIFSIKANNASKSVTKEINNFVQNQDFSLSIPVDQLFDVSDRAIYPISFDNVNFYLDPSMSVGKSYTMAVKSIVLCYADVALSYSPEKTDFFNIYPNPVISGQSIFLSMKKESSQTIYTEIYDLTGRKIRSHQHSYEDGEIVVLMKDILSGTYLLKAYDGDNVSVMKIIVR